MAKDKDGVLTERLDYTRREGRRITLGSGRIPFWSISSKTYARVNVLSAHLQLEVTTEPHFMIF